LTGRIAGLLGSPSLAPTKLDELKIKANILSSFAAKKVGEAYDAAGEYFEDATETVKSGAGEATEAVKEKVDQVAEGVEAFAAYAEEKVGGKIKGEL